MLLSHCTLYPLTPASAEITLSEIRRDVGLLRKRALRVHVFKAQSVDDAKRWHDALQNFASLSVAPTLSRPSIAVDVAEDSEEEKDEAEEETEGVSDVNEKASTEISDEPVVKNEEDKMVEVVSKLQNEAKNEAL